MPVDENDECAEELNRTEILMDLVIINYMRSLKLIAILSFVVLCGPIMLLQWIFCRPPPPVTAKTINEHFTKVTLKELNTS